MTPENVTLRLQSVRIRNFKAIVDSRTVVLGPLTASSATTAVASPA